MERVTAITDYVVVDAGAFCKYRGTFVYLNFVYFSADFHKNIVLLVELSF
jgi:hypothetical protein